jgi:hypothetical protein
MADQTAGAVAGIAAWCKGKQALSRQLDMVEAPDEFFGFATKHTPADNLDPPTIG